MSFCGEEFEDFDGEHLSLALLVRCNDSLIPCGLDLHKQTRSYYDHRMNKQYALRLDAISKTPRAYCVFPNPVILMGARRSNDTFAGGASNRQPL